MATKQNTHCLGLSKFSQLGYIAQLPLRINFKLNFNLTMAPTAPTVAPTAPTVAPTAPTIAPTAPTNRPDGPDKA